MKTGIVAGKFRLLHIGHKEYILRATLEDIDRLLIIIYTKPDDNRYSSITELKVAMSRILQDIDIDYKILVEEDIYGDDIQTRELNIVNKYNLDVENTTIYNSKEEYENIVLTNKYLNCYCNEKVLTTSATKIEANPYSMENYGLIADEFKPYMNKKVVLSGVESCGKTQFSTKLSRIYNTVYSPEVGRRYAGDVLGGNDEAFMPNDFVQIVAQQLRQDSELNRSANRFLVVDTDCYVTLRFLRSYKERYIELGLFTPEFEKGYNSAVLLLENICKDYKADKIFVLAPTVPFINDGTRWEQDYEERLKHHEELLNIYKFYNVDVEVVSDDNYTKRFDNIINSINKIFV